jgi:DNA (cytosine-5)-methyltransferase 1
MKGQSNACDLDKPLPTITAHAPHMYLCEPFIMHTTHQGSNRVHSVDKPLPTVTCAPRGEMALVEPFLVAFYGRSNVAAIDEPLDTITTKDRFGLVCCEPQKTRLDIRFRMLQPHELAAAMSFPANYEFVGNRQEKVKQIGNAVAVQTARAMALSLLSN